MLTFCAVLPLTIISVRTVNRPSAYPSIMGASSSVHPVMKSTMHCRSQRRLDQ